jgi:cellulose synthase/poly-beta-1,6-N-acetylglucosamine synthase-like glycosyltransferase
MTMILTWLPLVLFSLIALLQLFYYLRYFRLLAFYNPKESTFQHQHAVSIIICARDEADQLETNLPGVLVQEYKSTHEVVLVNDNSQDDTRYLLDGLYKQFRQLHIVELKQEAMHIPGKKFPLSVGIKSAKHELLLLTDADCIPASAQWLKKMQDAFAPGIEVVLGYGAYKKKKGLLNKIIRFDAFHTALQYFSFALGGMPYMGVGRNLAYKRTLFFEQKGFAAHHHLPGGDDDLFVNSCATSSNTAIVVDPDAFTYSTPPSTWSEWIAQKERHNSTGRYYKVKHRLVLGLYMASQFLYYPLFVFALFNFDWRWVMGIFALRLAVQTLILFRTLKKLGEKDLFVLFPFWDIWMFFYYLFFVSSLWKTPRNQWS